MIKKDRQKLVSIYEEPKFDNEDFRTFIARGVVKVYSYSVEDQSIQVDFSKIQREYYLDDENERQSLFNAFRDISDTDSVKRFVDNWGPPHYGMSVPQIIEASSSIKWLFRLSQLAKTNPKRLLNEGWLQVLEPPGLFLTDAFCEKLKNVLEQNGFDSQLDENDLKEATFASFYGGDLYHEVIPADKRVLFEAGKEYLKTKFVFFRFSPNKKRWKGVYHAAGSPVNWLSPNQLVVTIPRTVYKNWEKNKPEEYLASLCNLFLKLVFDELLKDVHLTAQLALKTESLKEKEGNYFFLTPALSVDTPYEAICLSLFDAAMERQPGRTCESCNNIFTPARKDQRCCTDNCRKNKSKEKQRKMNNLKTVRSKR